MQIFFVRWIYLLSKNMKLKDLCEDDRPREKMLRKGADALSNAELIAILLRTGTGSKNVVEVAREVLKEGESRLRLVSEMSLDRLCLIDGIGPGKAVTVAAAFELGRRVEAEAGSEELPQMDSPKKVYRLMLPVLRDKMQEECWVLFLNRSNRLLGWEMMSKGGQDATLMDKRVILRRALEKGSAAVIVVHNHPSGNPLPSVEDIRQTRELKGALSSCGLQLVDHVIIAGKSYYSFSDEVVAGG